MWAGVPVAHSQLLFLEMHITLCVCLCVCVCITDMSKQTQSSVEYFLGYLPRGLGRDEWVSGRRDGNKGQRQRSRVAAGQIKMRALSSRTLASQRERQRQSELRRREAEL